MIFHVSTNPLLIIRIVERTQTFPRARAKERRSKRGREKGRGRARERVPVRLRKKSARENAIYLTAGDDTGRNVIRRPSHYCDKLIASRRARNFEGKFSSGYESAAGCEHGGVYPRSLRLDNAPLACYNGGRRASRRPE